jgi:hypothetical protein
MLTLLLDPVPSRAIVTWAEVLLPEASEAP